MTNITTTCPHCGGDHEVTVNPAAMLGSRKKTVTPAVRDANSKRAKGWPKGKPRKVAQEK